MCSAVSGMYLHDGAGTSGVARSRAAQPAVGVAEVEESLLRGGLLGLCLVWALHFFD
jgi:hypothetical protein